MHSAIQMKLSRISSGISNLKETSMVNETSGSVERRLVSAKAIGVLGEFDHEFEFKASGEFAIVYGPNGVGKTRVLEIINALCNMSIGSLILLPFKSAALNFSDGSELQVKRILNAEPNDDIAIDNLPDHPELAIQLEFDLRRSGASVISRVNALSNFEVFLQRNSPYEPIDSDGTWMDPRDGEIIRYEDLRGMYLSKFRAENRLAGTKEKDAGEVHPEILRFAESLDVRLIETQRLMGLKLQQRDRHDDRRPYRGNAPRSLPTIVQYSDQIKLSLDNNLSANSRLTQSLDSTFPRRMLERGDTSVLTESELRDKWAEQTTRRARLTEIADLNVDPELSLPDGSLNPWQLGMLELYLADADVKLDSFSNVLKRIDLLEEIVNARLLRKTLHIDANDGLVVSRKLDNSPVPLTALSSGEQHEIILMFDLLFNVQSGSLVMIDEPEISLHIGWQKKFIADVLRISALVGFQFVVATHSPQIIDQWWSYATRLGPTSTDFMGEEDARDHA